MTEINSPIVIQEVNSLIDEVTTLFSKIESTPNFAGECWINKPSGLTSSGIKRQKWKVNPPALYNGNTISIEQVHIPKKLKIDDRISAKDTYNIIMSLADIASRVRRYTSKWYHYIDKKPALIDSVEAIAIFEERIHGPIKNGILLNNGDPNDGWILRYRNVEIPAGKFIDLKIPIDIPSKIAKDAPMKLDVFFAMIQEVRDIVGKIRKETIEFEYLTAEWDSRISNPYPGQIKG